MEQKEESQGWEEEKIRLRNRIKTFIYVGYISLLVIILINGGIIFNMFNNQTISGKVMAPSTRISIEDIFLFENQVVIDLQNFSGECHVSVFSDTGSMIPTLDGNHKAIECKLAQSDINVGDIISFKTDDNSSIIIHRVIDVGQDAGGWYSITQGDNLPREDSRKVRYNQVNGVVLALIY